MAEKGGCWCQRSKVRWRWVFTKWPEQETCVCVHYNGRTDSWYYAVREEPQVI